MVRGAMIAWLLTVFLFAAGVRTQGVPPPGLLLLLLIRFRPQAEVVE